MQQLYHYGVQGMEVTGRNSEDKLITLGILWVNKLTVMKNENNC